MVEGPTSWLEAHAGSLPAGGTALDVACWHGRHALWLARRGYEVTAIDRNPEALSVLAAEAATRGLELKTICADIEQPGFAFEQGAFNVIVAVNYLHRPLFPTLVKALRPEGCLVYETFTVAQARQIGRAHV